MSEFILNQYYPYERVQGYGTMPELEKVPLMIRDYLMDLPQKGYTPPDDNRFFRCKLMKYLYYDQPDALDQPLPTAEQKLSLVFNPESPDIPPTEKGYRIFSQMLVSEAQTVGQSIMRVFMGRVVPIDMYTVQASVVLQFLCNSAYDTYTRGTALSKSFAMCCLAQRALSGVNFGAGVGTMYFNRGAHSDSEIITLNDETTNVGYALVMALTVMGTDKYDQ